MTRVRSLSASAPILLPLLLLSLGGAPASAQVPKKAAVMDAELEGDLGDSTRLPEWNARLARLTASLRGDLAKMGLYQVTELDPAAASLDALRNRLHVHGCPSCLADVAQEAGAERLLDSWVFRMSNLALTLHIEIRNGTDGRLLLRRAYDFKGDNDRAWEMAEAFAVRDLAKVPPEFR